MRRTTWLQLTVGLLAIGFLIPSRGLAQSPEPARKFAIIDIAFIFKNAISIKNEVDAIEQQMIQLQRFGKSKQQEMLNEAEAIRSLERGTVEYAQQEEKVAALESTLKLEVFRRRKRLADAETQLYFTNYRKMHRIIKQLAESNNIDVVFRYDSESMDIDKPDTVLRGVMKNVVYRSAAIDITKVVMSAMDQTQLASAPAANAIR